jgi:hypothetical protein
LKKQNKEKSQEKEENTFGSGWWLKPVANSSFRLDFPFSSIFITSLSIHSSISTISFSFSRFIIYKHSLSQFNSSKRGKLNMGMKQVIKNLDAFPRAEDHLLQKTQSGALGNPLFFLP